MAVMLSAAQSLAWICRITGCQDVSDMDRQVAQLPAQARLDAPLFLPYLSGERTPHNNPLARGALVGLREHHGPAELGYAVMEGVCFGLMDGWHAMGGRQDGLSTLALVGGGSRSATWAQLIASGMGVVLQRPLDAAHAAAVGSARLAWMADGGQASEVCAPLAMRDAFAPDALQAQQLAPRYQRFRELYALALPPVAQQ
jgi:xylulokinase